MPFPDSQYPSILRGYDKRQSQRLLAAAPDLLEACRAIDKAYDRTDSYTEGRAMQMVMAAIAKAEGRGE